MDSGETLPPRERIIKTTSDLLELQGYHGTGLNQIIQESQTPKGSLYHYFPAGKEELAAEALEIKGRFVAERIKEGLALHPDPAEALRSHLLRMAAYVQHCHFPDRQPFNSITVVALETAYTSEPLRQTCLGIYRTWRSLMEQKFLESGFPPEQADRLAWFTAAVIDGAMTQTIMERSPKPLEYAAETLYTLIRTESETLT